MEMIRGVRKGGGIIRLKSHPFVPLIIRSFIHSYAIHTVDLSGVITVMILMETGAIILKKMMMMIVTVGILGSSIVIVDVVGPSFECRQM